MNSVVVMGRLCKDPETRYSTGDMAVSCYTLAVDRRGKKDEADFISCIAFGKSGEFAEKYFRKGMRVLVSGHIRSGSYTNKEGKKVYTTDVVVDNQEFAESKKESASPESGDEFVNIPDDLELPFA